MPFQLNHPEPGTYLYDYPSFSDSLQQICIHYYSEDKAMVYVSYPGHVNGKAPRWVKSGWFRSIRLLAPILTKKCFPITVDRLAA